MSKLYIINGPEKGKSFELKKDVLYIGRSSDNDIQILDKMLSRSHLKIRRAGNKYFITDLKSQNGTFINGKNVSPGIELEVKEGVRIVIGTRVICIGEKCLEQVAPFLDSTEPKEEIDERIEILKEKREKTNQKNLELIYEVSDILLEKDIKVTLEKALDQIFGLLNRVDRGVIVIVDPETKTISEVIYRSKLPNSDPNTIFCKDVVDKVLKEEKAVVISDVRIDIGDKIADTLKVSKIESVMCVPLKGTSKIMGALYVDSLNRPCGFRKDDLSLFNDIGGRAAVAIEYSFLTAK